MKKLFGLIALLFVFSGNVSAQEKANASELAKRDLTALSQTISLTEQNRANFLDLFQKKHEALSQPGITEGKKKIIYKSIDAKLRASLSAGDMEKLDKNPELLKKLTQN